MGKENEPAMKTVLRHCIPFLWEMKKRNGETESALFGSQDSVVPPAGALRGYR